MQAVNLDSLTEDQIREFGEAFSLFDKEGKGTITTDDLGAVMESLGLNRSEAELKNMLKDVDAGGNGTIEFPEFLSLVTAKAKEKSDQAEIVEAFLTFDRNNDGFITADEIYHIMGNLGEKLTREEVAEMMREANADQGKLDYKQFVAMMSSK